MPAKPRWLLAIPDAISQLEQLDRQLLTRRDIEGLGPSRPTAISARRPRGAAAAQGQLVPLEPRLEWPFPRPTNAFDRRPAGTQLAPDSSVPAADLDPGAMTCYVVVDNSLCSTR